MLPIHVSSSLTAGVGSHSRVKAICVLAMRSVWLGTASLAMSAPGMAQERPQESPSAFITIDQVQVAFIGSGSIGNGTLTFNGRSYPLRVGGLGVGGIGVSYLKAAGAVYGLHRKADLAGGYLQVRKGWALADKGGGVLWLRNGKGVTMRLKSRRQGLQLALGADGVVIGFR